MRTVIVLTVLTCTPAMAQEQRSEDALYRGRNPDAVRTERLPMRMRERLRQQVQQAMAEPSKSRDVQAPAEAPPPMRRSKSSPADM